MHEVEIVEQKEREKEEDSSNMSYSFADSSNED